MVEMTGSERANPAELCRNRGYHQTKDVHPTEYGSRNCVDCHSNFDKGAKYQFIRANLESQEYS